MSRSRRQWRYGEEGSERRTIRGGEQRRGVGVREEEREVSVLLVLMSVSSPGLFKDLQGAWVVAVQACVALEERGKGWKGWKQEEQET